MQTVPVAYIILLPFFTGCIIAKFLKGIELLVRRVVNAFGFLLRGEFDLLIERLSAVVRGELFASHPLRVRIIAILSIPHTASVSMSYAYALRQLGFEVLETDHYSRKIRADLWIVFGAQVISKLPPTDKRIVVQLEQTSSKRWFSRRYKSALNNSLAVIDFSVSNLAGLSQHGISYPQVFLVRLGCMQSMPKERHDRDIDVLFYGDPYCDRRQKFLNALSEKFDLRIISSCFGTEMFDLISRARVVVNIHYYEQANLEATRIFECLAFGTKVVSEHAPDTHEYEGLDALVDFVPVGAVDQMCDLVAHHLSCDQAPEYEANAYKFRERMNARLVSSLSRTLVGIGVDLPNNSIDRSDTLTGCPLVLALPETFERFSRAKSYFPSSFTIFEGLRAKPAWIGCALSYQAIGRLASRQNLGALWVFEDDAELPDNSDVLMRSMESFLDSQILEWDMFCGIIARFDKPFQIIDVAEFQGLKFVVLDTMMSMVANRYSSHVLQVLSEWNPNDEDAERNTIDQYLNEHVQRVVTTLPFQFGHNVDERSTLWGIPNSRYSDLIRDAEQQLTESVEKFELSRASR